MPDDNETDPLGEAQALIAALQSDAARMRAALTACRDRLAGGSPGMRRAVWLEAHDPLLARANAALRSEA